MAKKTKPNILLIAIDSLCQSHMSCYGYPRRTTPHMDRFAEGGAIFDNTFSAHIPTTSAYVSMLSGMESCLPRVSMTGITRSISSARETSFE